MLVSALSNNLNITNNWQKKPSIRFQEEGLFHQFHDDDNSIAIIMKHMARKYEIAMDKYFHRRWRKTLEKPRFGIRVHR
jgi:hypothetical protein